MAESRDVLTRAARTPTTTIRYGDGPDHVADVWLPAGGSAAALPLVVVIHGGFWRSGYGRSIAGPMSVALTDQGFVTMAIEYRRTGSVGDRAGGWPMTVDDVRTAVERGPDLLTEATGVRTDRTVLVGHSAGGQLAVWSGSQATIPGLAGVVSLGGVVDLVRADELRLGLAADDGAVAALLGGRATDRPDRYSAADPMQLPPPPAPVVLIHGVDDPTVPVELSRRYADYAAGLGADVRLVELAGVEHLAPVDPLTEAWPPVLAAVQQLARPH